MVHVLDLKAATARCIDLPGTGDYGSATSYGARALARRQHALGGRARATAALSRSTSPRARSPRPFRFQLPAWNVGTGTSAALAPDGQHVALSDNETVAIVGLAEHKVMQRDPGKALALGYSPDGTLWKLT